MGQASLWKNCPIAAIGGRGTEEISEWLQGGFCIHDLHACMIGFRSDHACMIQNSETDWMRARGQPASTRAWPAASMLPSRITKTRLRLVSSTRHQTSTSADNWISSPRMAVKPHSTTARCSSRYALLVGFICRNAKS